MRFSILKVYFLAQEYQHFQVDNQPAVYVLFPILWLQVKRAQHQRVSRFSVLISANFLSLHVYEPV